MSEAANSYGFDFLRTEHTLTDDGHPKAGVSAVSSTAAQALVLMNNDAEALHQLAASVAHKPDLEKQFDVIHFLQAHRSAGCLPPSVIFKATGIDLEETDESVAQMLQRNPKIKVETIPDPENPNILLATYAYQAKYNHVRNLKTLLAQINRCNNGVPMRDLLDAYDGVEDDLQRLITAGDVLAIANSEDKDKILFPRGDAFLVEMDGIISLPKEYRQKLQLIKKEKAMNNNNSNGNKANNEDTATDPDKQNDDGEDVAATIPADQQQLPTSPTTLGAVVVLETDVDPRKQIRRGEAVQIGGQWFRVSSAVREGVSLAEQPVRAQAPLSVVSLQDLSKRNEQDGYIRPLTQKNIPVDAPLAEAAIHNLRASKRARDRLHKLAAHNGRSMSTAAQLLSSHAHASNPTVLAQSFAMAGHNADVMNHHNIRKRPAAAATTKQQQRGAGGALQGGSGGPGAAGSGGTGGEDATTALANGRRDALAAQMAAASDPALSLYAHARRHGCTKDVREMYFTMTRNKIPDSDAELQKVLIEHQLLDPGEQMRRPRLAKRSNVDNDGKPKKRRYYERKNQRMTNTHLEGTEIGAVLRRATEKQQQGKSVGDGGM